MKYILFDKSAVTALISFQEYQTTEYEKGMNFINAIQSGDSQDFLFEGAVRYDSKDDGLFIVGKNRAKEILVFDLTQCDFSNEYKNPAHLLLIMQKTFRASIRAWERQPFTFSERVHNSKLIIFPFSYNSNENRFRVVIEREPQSKRLIKREIKQPLLVYKYSDANAPNGEESPNIGVLEKAGERYLELYSEFVGKLKSESLVPNQIVPFAQISSDNKVKASGFAYLSLDEKRKRLTSPQRSVVDSDSMTSPIRIDGPAGTGKTTSLIMRAYRLLSEKRMKGESYKITFFAHNESTRQEIVNAFQQYELFDSFQNASSLQQIKVTTILRFCMEFADVPLVQIIDIDAMDAKQYQWLLLIDSFQEAKNEFYKTHKPLLSKELIDLLENTEETIIVEMLKHEFSIQIKGRTNGTIEEYREIASIDNGVPVKCTEDKNYIFRIYQIYQNKLQSMSVYDTDDVVIQALALLNAPLWRRERSNSGYEYIFVDEMHMFNANEQYIFHYLTKDITQNEIPICFALDYSQAFGERGNVAQDYIENFIGKQSVKKEIFQTVFRSSQYITDFCASIAASGSLMFQLNFKNPYLSAQSGFTEADEKKCSVPTLHMYSDENAMVVDAINIAKKFKRELQCKYNEIAIITFAQGLQELIRATKGVNFVSVDDGKGTDAIILTTPYDINGLEFQGVILVGVDEGRVPQTEGVADVASNYIRYVAFNQIYLAASRAKYQLAILGDKLHGVSSCFRYALDNKTIEQIDES
jgi:superfamily I DNA/RNA helicase